MSKPGGMREVMPWAASIVDEWREAFGAEAVNQLMREGLKGEPGKFYASEGGNEIGTPSDWPAERLVPNTAPFSPAVKPARR